jgi:hypothetical protein
LIYEVIVKSKTTLPKRTIDHCSEISKIKPPFPPVGGKGRGWVENARKSFGLIDMSVAKFRQACPVRLVDARMVSPPSLTKGRGRGMGYEMAG